MTDLQTYANSILERGNAKEVRIYNSPLGLILRAETSKGVFRKNFINYTKPTIEEMAEIGNNGYLSFSNGWLKGDKLRHKNSFNSVIFVAYSKGTEYFYHEESGIPLMSKHYVKAPGDN